MSLNLPVCPQGCAFQLPELDQDLCTPNVSFGEITHLYIAAGDAASFTDIEDLAEWTARLNDTSADPDAIRTMFVIADLPAATSEEIAISVNRKVYSPADHVINVDVDDISESMYNFGRATSCNVGYKIWFGTPDYIFGGNEGIDAMLNLRPVIERGAKSVHKLTGTVTWSAKFSPERNVSPFAS